MVLSIPAAVLTTGRPQLDKDGSLSGIQVTGGDIAVDGDGLKSENAPDKLDILTGAAKINAQLWAKNDLNVVTGSNLIDYNTLQTRTLPGAADSGVSLDISAVGGMYAGRIMLQGTSKGLGVNVDGQLYSKGDLSISSSGMLSVQGDVAAAGKVSTTAADDVTNAGQISAGGDVTVTSGGMTKNTGYIAAGQAQDDDDETDSPAALPADISVKAGANINSDGILKASRNITLAGKKIKYNIQNTDAAQVTVNETDPDPVQPPEKPVPQAPVQTEAPEKKIVNDITPGASGTADIPDYANVTTTKKQDKQDVLPLVADQDAPEQYKPIADKAADGIDLIQIATADGSGVLRNLYTDFNVGSRGLIFNNAIGYTATRLGGYIDRNFRLGTVAARTILNEVTGTRPTRLNGYMEIAGQKADLVIANPNGIAINGGGYINTASAVLAAAPVQNRAGHVDFAAPSADILIQGEGLDADTTNKLIIQTKNFTNDASELWSNSLELTAGGILYNSGKLAADQDMQLHADNLTNEKSAVITGGGTLSITAAESIKNNSAVIHGGADSTMTAQTIDNTDKAAIYSDENLLLTAGKSLVNDDSVVKAGKDADLQAASLTGTGAEITAGGRLTASAGVINNTNTNLAAKESVSLTALGSIKNQNTAIYADKDLTIKAAALLNKTSLLAAGGQTGLSTGILENTDSSVIYGSSDMNIAASDYLLNSSSDIESGQNLCITAGRLTNEKTAFDTDWTITHQDISYGIAHWNGNYYSASRRFDREIKTGTIEKETPTAHITADKNVAVTVNKLVNHYSEITAGTDLAINAADSLENLGYQGTIIATDTGNDYQNWKYKKKGRWWKHSHWVYGTTVVPYYDQNITDETTQRAGILSGGARVNITAPQIKNITYDAGKNEITQRPAAATASADRTLIDARLIQYAGTDSHRFCINKDPSAKYLIETNPRFADYHSFLSSDYLLQRIKNDPEKVMKRLGDGYYEQKLVTDQITGLTGRRYLDNYSSALDQYKALMDNGAAFAQKYDLTTGVALSKEQMAELTCDIVWLVKENINGQDVLVPKVYLSSLKNGDLRQSGALITGTDVTLISPKDLQNIGTIKADKDLTIKSGSLENKNAVVVGGDIAIKADGDVENSGAVINGQNVSIAAQNIINNTRTVTTQYRQLSQTLLGSTASINAAKDLTLSAAASIEDKGGTLAAGQGLVLTAQKDINIENISQKQHVAVAYGSSSAELSSVENFGSNIAAGGDISITGTKVTLKASSLDAGGKAAVTAEKDIDITDAKDDNESDIAVGSRGGSYFARQKHDDETVVGAAVSAAGDIAIKSGGSVDIKGSAITSDKGAVSLAAQGNINLVNDTGHHESIYELHKKDKGFLASKTTDIYDYKSSDDVVKSSIEGKDIAGLADKDINITGSSAVADNDVSLKAGGDINIISAEEQSGSTYYRSVKKSGLLSGGGLGFTIGKESAKDKLQNTDTEQIAATVGSIGGSVDIAAGSKAAVKGSDIMAGKDINITAGQVDIQNTDNVYTSKEDHEYKKSGLTVSIGGQAVKTADDITAPVQRIGQVEDDRLKALYAKKAYDQIKDAKDTIRDINKKGIKSAISIDVSLGSSKSESHSTSTDIEAKGSSISAAKDVSITANKTDINIKGSTVAGNNITLDAKRDINLTAAQNSNKTDSTASSASSSIGASIGLAGGVSYNARLEKNSSATRENTTAYTNTEVTAGDTLKTNSGEDTTITGAKASGGKVEMNVGRDLAIKSLQDADDYNEHNSSSGIAIATGGTNASADKGRIDSDYQSTADQSGIYAGKDGFDITVGKNTDLKGAVIDSDAAPDKNKLSTDTLTYSDIDNKASYDSKNTGVNYNTGKDVKPKDKGLTPDIGVEAKGNAAGTTKSAIAPGTIDIRGNPGQDISGLSRDTKDALNKLGKIFDKDKILEKQELAKLFGEEIFKTIGDLGLKDGSPEKTALDAFAGGIMSKLGGSSFVAGAAGAGINEVIIKELGEIRDPAVMQWASAAVGAAAAKVTGGSAAAGAGAAASETKNNWLSHEQVQAFEDRASQIQSEYLAGEITESEEKKLMIELGRTYRIIDIIQSDNSYYNEFKDDNGQAWETGVYMADPFRFIGILKGNPSYNENLFNDTENYAINSYFANHPVTLYDLGVITPQGNSIIKTLSMIQKPAWLIMFTRHWI